MAPSLDQSLASLWDILINVSQSIGSTKKKYLTCFRRRIKRILQPTTISYSIASKGIVADLRAMQNCEWSMLDNDCSCSLLSLMIWVITDDNRKIISASLWKFAMTFGSLLSSGTECLCYTVLPPYFIELIWFHRVALCFIILTEDLHLLFRIACICCSKWSIILEHRWLSSLEAVCEMRHVTWIQ